MSRLFLANGISFHPTAFVEYTGLAKNGAIFVHLIILPNITNFQHFYCQNQETICNKIITIYPITP